MSKCGHSTVSKQSPHLSSWTQSLSPFFAFPAVENHWTLCSAISAFGFRFFLCCLRLSMLNSGVSRGSERRVLRGFGGSLPQCHRHFLDSLLFSTSPQATNTAASRLSSFPSPAYGFGVTLSRKALSVWILPTVAPWYKRSKPFQFFITFRHLPVLFNGWFLHIVQSF